MLEDFYHYSFLGGRLVGSEQPGAVGFPKRVVEHFVTRLGVRTLLTLTPGFVDFGRLDLVQYHVPIAKVPTLDDARRAVAIIRERLAAGGVWVHCQHGTDRTGCIIGCYLVSAGEPAENVIAELVARLPERRRDPFYVALWQPYAEQIRAFAPLAPLVSSARDRG